MTEDISSYDAYLDRVTSGVNPESDTAKLERLQFEADVKELCSSQVGLRFITMLCKRSYMFEEIADERTMGRRSLVLEILNAVRKICPDKLGQILKQE